MSHYKFDKDTAFVIIDAQTGPLEAMPSKAVEPFLDNINILTTLANDRGSSVYYTEQYPDGLGPTDETLLENLSAADAERFEKVEFNVCDCDAFADQLGQMPDRVFLTGLETHICVLLTAKQLIEHGHEVFVPFDAVLSRRKSYKDNGLELLRQVGATVLNTETIVFDSLETAKADQFKKYSKLVQ